MLLSDRLIGFSIPKKMLYLLIGLLITYCLMYSEYNYLILAVGCLIVTIKDDINFRNVCICYLVFTLGISSEYNITFITLVAMGISLVCMVRDAKNIKYYTIVCLVFVMFVLVDLGVSNYKAKVSDELDIKEKKFATIVENWTNKEFYMQALEKDDVDSFVKN